MAKRGKRKNYKEKAEKAYDFYEFIANIVDIVANILSPKIIGPLALVVGAAAGGGFFGYQFGFDDGLAFGEASVICEECEVCEICEVCPEPVECPEIPECPRPITDYTCAELDAEREDCFCIVN